MTRPWNSRAVSPLLPADWVSLATVLAVAIAIRVLFYTGFFGSDEVTYIETAAKIASGDWRASTYVGATRYGMNLPVALFIYLFGLSQFSANLWPFLCSVGEVAVVYFIARWLWSSRTAAISAGLLALLPLHVMFAGRMMADPPLAFFLTLSVALLLLAARSRTWGLFFSAGLAWGGVFWVKESVAILYAPVFLLLAYYLNRLRGRWPWLFAGMAIAVLANCALMYFVAGNPLHLFAVMKGGLASYAGLAAKTSPWYYLRYLFVDIRHTFLLGFLVVGGIIFYARSHLRGGKPVPGIQFVVLWALLMIGLFSFAIVSFSPVKLVMKQTNYMLIFCGPLALLAGWFLSALSQKAFLPVAALVVAGSAVLAAFEQQAVSVFTANSRAFHAYLRDHPNAFLIGTTNNQRAVNFYSMMENRLDLRNRVTSFGEALPGPGSTASVDWTAKTSGKDVFAVLDLQTIDWGYKPSSIKRLDDVPKCWMPSGLLAPAALGSGSWVVKGLVLLGGVLPDGLRKPYLSALQPVSTPLPAHLFRVDAACLSAPQR